jgi:hypothetical protein
MSFLGLWKQAAHRTESGGEYHAFPYHSSSIPSDSSLAKMMGTKPSVSLQLTESPLVQTILLNASLRRLGIVLKRKQCNSTWDLHSLCLRCRRSWRLKQLPEFAPMDYFAQQKNSEKETSVMQLPDTTP